TVRAAGPAADRRCPASNSRAVVAAGDPRRADRHPARQGRPLPPAKEPLRATRKRTGRAWPRARSQAEPQATAGFPCASASRCFGQRAWLDVGNRRLLRILEDQLFPCALVREQRAQQAVVQPVSGFVAGEFADETVAEQVEITDRIEDLVLDELILG